MENTVKEEAVTEVAEVPHTDPWNECKACFPNGPVATTQTADVPTLTAPTLTAPTPEPLPPAEPATLFDSLRGFHVAKGRSYDLTARSQYELEEQHESLVDTIAAAPLYEGEFVLARLRRGKVNGGSFGDGGRECSCLLGTMATAANFVEKKNYDGGRPLGMELYNSYLGVDHYPAQDLFGGIDVGDKPSNSASAALADQYITELLMSNRAELGREERAAMRKLERAFGIRR